MACGAWARRAQGSLVEWWKNSFPLTPPLSLSSVCLTPTTFLLLHLRPFQILYMDAFSGEQASVLAHRRARIRYAAETVHNMVGLNQPPVVAVVENAPGTVGPEVHEHLMIYPWAKTMCVHHFARAPLNVTSPQARVDGVFRHLRCAPTPRDSRPTDGSHGVAPLAGPTVVL